MPDFFIKIPSESTENYCLLNLSQIDVIFVNRDKQRIGIRTKSSITYELKGENAKKFLQKLKVLMEIQGYPANYQLNQQTEEQV